MKGKENNNNYEERFYEAALEEFERAERSEESERKKREATKNGKKEVEISPYLIISSIVVIIFTLVNVIGGFVYLSLLKNISPDAFLFLIFWVLFDGALGIAATYMSIHSRKKTKTLANILCILVAIDIIFAIFIITRAVNAEYVETVINLL